MKNRYFKVQISRKLLSKRIDLNRIRNICTRMGGIDETCRRRRSESQSISDQKDPTHELSRAG